MNVPHRARIALHARFAAVHSVPTDTRGYTSCPQGNLLPGLDWPAIEADFSGADGHELDGKIRAVHSSAALAVNSFGIFRTCPQRLWLLGRSGAQSLQFERKAPTSLRGTPPNLDVWIEREGETVAVESKLLEYLCPKAARFANAYARLVEQAEPCWQEAYAHAECGEKQYLDRAQLIKHHFGLRAYQGQHPEQQVHLLYLFWEPLNWCDLPECRQHREELHAFTDLVSSSSLRFRWMTYSQLWEEWSAVPALADHAERLRARYEVCV